MSSRAVPAVRPVVRPVVAAVAVACLTACSAPQETSAPRRAAPASPPSVPSSASPADRPVDQAEPSATAGPRTSGPRPPTMSDGRPRRAVLSIPALRLDGLVVVPYVGHTDDAAGTRIQDQGLGASPQGPGGGVGAGGLGNYQVTAHRTSSTAAFGSLPVLSRGDRVQVRSGPTVFVYEIRQTRRTSFRSDASLAQQRAAVPGRPGVRPTQAYLTLSTCATPEDHAAGNLWSDALHNPEHRIDKIGVLVATRPG